MVFEFINALWNIDCVKNNLVTKQFVHRNPLAQMEEEKREHDLKMKKMESEMEQVNIFQYYKFWQKHIKGIKQEATAV